MKLKKTKPGFFEKKGTRLVFLGYYRLRLGPYQRCLSPVSSCFRKISDTISKGQKKSIARMNRSDGSLRETGEMFVEEFDPVRLRSPYGLPLSHRP